jgi:hypothetical protein
MDLSYNKENKEMDIMMILKKRTRRRKLSLTMVKAMKAL